MRLLAGLLHHALHSLEPSWLVPVIDHRLVPAVDRPDLTPGQPNFRPAPSSGIPPANQDRLQFVLVLIPAPRMLLIDQAILILPPDVVRRQNNKGSRNWRVDP